MAYLLQDTFLTDTTASYTKVGSWLWSSGNKNITNSPTPTNGFVQTLQSDNVSAKGSIVINTTGANSAEYLGLAVTASSDGTKGYAVIFRGTDTSNIWLLDGGVAFVTSGAFAWTTGTKYWVKIYRNGTNVKCKVWADGNAEPASWLIDTTVTARADAYVGFQASSGTGAAHGTYDDLYVWSGITEPTAGGAFLLNFI